MFKIVLMFVMALLSGALITRWVENKVSKQKIIQFDTHVRGPLRKRLVEPTPSLTTKYGNARLRNFKDRFTGGGMTLAEQELLADTYAHSKNVFEWGMGSSTLIAEYMGIQRLTAVDSADVWVKKCRSYISKHYKLVHADIGDVKGYGEPKDKSLKEQWPDYSKQVDREQTPFDVYLVDGRFRMACALRALMHGTNTSLVLMHDFQRQYYHPILNMADRIRQVGLLVVLRKKKTVTKRALQTLWEKYKYVTQ